MTGGMVKVQGVKSTITYSGRTEGWKLLQKGYKARMEERISF
jgi:hypothetical protein